MKQNFIQVQRTIIQIIGSAYLTLIFIPLYFLSELLFHAKTGMC